MKLNVIFRTVTPYHSSQPGISRVDLNGNFISNGQGFPCIRTRHSSFLIPTDEKWDRQWRPIMPANSLRHALRERIAQRYFDAFRGKCTLSLGAYAAILSGNATGNPDGAPAPFTVIQKTRNHPFLGLFGGGPRMIEGKLIVDQAIPIVSSLLGYIPDAPQELALPDSVRLTEIVFKRRVDPVMKLDENQIDLIAGLPESMDAWFNSYYAPSSGVKQEKTAKKDDESASAVNSKETKAAKKNKESKETKEDKEINEQEETKENNESGRGLMAFNAHEVVIPGVPWMWKVHAKAPLTPAQIGALLDGVSQLHGTRLGGMSALGYGQIEIMSITLDSTEYWDAQSHTLQDNAAEYLNTWIESIDETPEAFEKFISGE